MNVLLAVWKTANMVTDIVGLVPSRISHVCENYFFSIYYASVLFFFLFKRNLKSITRAVGTISHFQQGPENIKLCI